MKLGRDSRIEFVFNILNGVESVLGGTGSESVLGATGSGLTLKCNTRSKSSRQGLFLLGEAFLLGVYKITTCTGENKCEICHCSLSGGNLD